jgi:hypothetical protein
MSVWKIRPDGTTRTLLTSSATTLPHRWSPVQARINIDTGKVLVNDHVWWTSPTTIRYPIYELDSETGKFTTWTTGGTGLYGSWDLRAMPQNHRSGMLEGASGYSVYRTRPGTTNRSILASLKIPVMIMGGGDFDLQTAARPSLVYLVNVLNQATALFRIDTTRWSVSSFVASPSHATTRPGFAFYRGRHTQTVRTANRRWKIRLSVPSFPGRSYAIAAGLSGVRPGVGLPDGRRLNLNLDSLVTLTLHDRLPGLWFGGPGLLDSNGEASGFLDMSKIGTLGIPLWIAWVILDPKAPLGIAYMPDTHVMRI